MTDQPFSYDQLYRIIEWEAGEAGLSVSEYVTLVTRKMEQHRSTLEKLVKSIDELSSSDKAFVLEKLGLVADHDSVDSQPPCCPCDGYTLQELSRQNVEELVKTKPRTMIINGSEIQVRSWTDVSIQFVAYMVNNGLLKKQDLPLCPNPKSAKAYVNFYPGQPSGVRESGIFKSVGDGFYVDIKLNAKYHILNMLRSLQTLKIQDDCKISIVI